jgi:predicted nucleotidyltransferase component of viral defense system
MKDTYDTPNSLRAALSSRAKVDAKERGVPSAHLQDQFTFQRFLARVFSTDDGWMLKGGQALLVRFPTQARNSRDIDLLRPDVDDVDEAVAALEAAAAIDLGDFFSFTPRGREPGTCATKVIFAATIGPTDWGKVKVDVAVKRVPTATPTRQVLVPAISLCWPDTWPEVLLYPLPDHIADKICAMYEWRRNTPSTRARDLADLVLISQQEKVVGREVQLALASEKIRCTAPGIDLRLPDAFHVPDPIGWVRLYREAAADVNGLVGCTTLDKAAAAAHGFITPLLGTTDPGTWDPEARAWRQ